LNFTTKFGTKFATFAEKLYEINCNWACIFYRGFGDEVIRKHWFPPQNDSSDLMQGFFYNGIEAEEFAWPRQSSMNIYEQQQT
jgi:hypothetical protein